MQRFNVATGELPAEGDRSAYAWPASEWTFPHHYHHGVEEWLYVVAGAPRLRQPARERVLEPGDMVCFPSGPDGAHAVRGPGAVRDVLRQPRAVLRDLPGQRQGLDDHGHAQDSDAVDYWTANRPNER
jgi:hypothetical protein